MLGRVKSNGLLDWLVLNVEVTDLFMCVSLTQAYFEQWLRMMLLWEPRGRGQKAPSQPGADRQRPYCFEFLDQILNTKVYDLYSRMFCYLYSELLMYSGLYFLIANG